MNLRQPCTENELKHSFRELAFQHHPDKGGSAEKFKEIIEAYQTIMPLVEGLKKDVAKTIEGSPLKEVLLMWRFTKGRQMLAL